MQKSPNIFMCDWHGVFFSSDSWLWPFHSVTSVQESGSGHSKWNGQSSHRGQWAVQERAKKEESFRPHGISSKHFSSQTREGGLSPWAESLPVHTRGLEETRNTPTTMMIRSSVLSWVMSYRDFWDSCQQPETHPLISRLLWRKICVCLHPFSALRFLTKNLKGCMSDADRDSSSGQNPSNESNYLLSDRSGQSCLVGTNYRHLYLLKKHVSMQWKATGSWEGT